MLSWAGTGSGGIGSLGMSYVSFMEAQNWLQSIGTVAANAGSTGGGISFLVSGL